MRWVIDIRYLHFQVTGAQTQSGGGPVSRPSLSFPFPALFLKFLFMPFVHFLNDDAALEFGRLDAFLFCTAVEPFLVFHRDPG